MDFYEELTDRQLRDVIEPVKFSLPNFFGFDKVNSFMLDIIKNNRRVLIYGDYDPDGLFGLLIGRETFRFIRYKNYETFKYSNRTHTLDNRAVSKAIEEKFDYIIVIDTGSNEIDKLKKLNYFGVKVILLDHHQTILRYQDYPDNCAVINTIIENKMLRSDEFVLSGAALTYLVMEKFLFENNFGSCEPNVFYALCSLYSDCIDMSKALNRAIYYKCLETPMYNLPCYIKHFFTERTVFCRRFIEYSFIPKLNSIFRSEHFEMINDYMLEEDNSFLAINKQIKDITDLYESARELVGKVTDIVEYKIYNNFVVANLSSVNDYINVDSNKLYNYTGLVANNLASRYAKTAVVYCDNGSSVKGSLRDTVSRNYLTLFQQFCSAGGHNSAFGININYVDFNEFLEYIDRIDNKFYIENIPNNPITIPHNYAKPDDQLLRDMSVYNEFSGNQIPISLVIKKLVGGMQEYSSDYYKSYKWGSYYIKSTTRLNFGSDIYAKPVRGQKIQLYASDVKLGG